MILTLLIFQLYGSWIYFLSHTQTGSHEAIPWILNPMLWFWFYPQEKHNTIQENKKIWRILDSGWFPGSSYLSMVAQQTLPWWLPVLGPCSFSTLEIPEVGKIQASWGSITDILFFVWAGWHKDKPFVSSPRYIFSPAPSMVKYSWSTPQQ